MPARPPEDDAPDAHETQDVAHLREAQQIALCGPDDISVEVHWSQGDVGLRGQVVARNTGQRACRLPGKPSVTPLAADGTPLPVPTTITLEFVSPGYAVLQPGDVATARISWNSWCGQPASDRALVNWNSGSATVPVHGPVQPACDPDRRAQVTSYWFFVGTPASEA
jgi:hypothetical protein